MNAEHIQDLVAHGMRVRLKGREFARLHQTLSAQEQRQAEKLIRRQPYREWRKQVMKKNGFSRRK